VNERDGSPYVPRDVEHVWMMMVVVDDVDDGHSPFATSIALGRPKPGPIQGEL